MLRSFIALLYDIVAETKIAFAVQTKGLDVDKVVITHVQANQAPCMRRRTYRAHGRIGGMFCDIIMCIFHYSFVSV